ncbi:MAG TPA: hypothetical protein VN764_17120, partial [Polyangiaceae bacterium]|nr:hypothetical protein [Polyangiaceae bacterium]
WGHGIDSVGELLDLGQEHGHVSKAGAYLALDGQNLGQGREKARAHLLEHADTLKRLVGLLRNEAAQNAA